MIKVNTSAARIFSENLKSLTNKIDADVYQEGSIPGMFNRLSEVGLVFEYFEDIFNKVEQICTSSHNLSDTLLEYAKSLENIEKEISKNTPNYGETISKVAVNIE